jgi:hypothetical protein
MSSARLVLLLGAVLLGTAVQAAKPQVLRGKLLDESGKPLADEKVFLLPGDFKLPAEAKRLAAAALATGKTDSKGRFSFERLEKRGARRRGKGLPAGDYLVAAFKEEKGATAGLRVASQQAVVGKKKTAEVEVRYPPVAPTPAVPPQAAEVPPVPVRSGGETVLEGTVMDGSGKPLEGVTIAIQQPSASLQSAQTNGEGRFSLPGLRPGAAELRISDIPGSRALQFQEKVELPEKSTVRFELRLSQSPKG